MSLTSSDESLNSPNIRKPLTGHLTMRIHAVRDVDHAASSRFSRGGLPVLEAMACGAPVITSRDTACADMAGDAALLVDPGNEEEIEAALETVVTRPSLAEEMRRKKIESEFNTSGWVSADKMEHGGGMMKSDSQYQMNAPPGQFSSGARPPGPTSGGGQVPTIMIDSWFALEPVGRIHLTMSFGKFFCDR